MKTTTVAKTTGSSLCMLSLRDSSLQEFSLSISPHCSGLWHKHIAFINICRVCTEFISVKYLLTFSLAHRPLFHLKIYECVERVWVLCGSLSQCHQWANSICYFHLYLYIHRLPFNRVGSVQFNTFNICIQQRCIKVIKCDSKMKFIIMLQTIFI